MKVALVYDRINKFGGAERVLIELHRLWPDAPVFTSVYDHGLASWSQGWDIRTSGLQRFSSLRRSHEMLGWLMPSVFESLDFSEFDVVFSVTSEAAKGVITTPRQLHVCYLLTPTRYLWSHEKEYLNEIPSLLRPAAALVQTGLRRWDFIAAQRADQIISISRLVRQRCFKYYRRESEVIYPPRPHLAVRPGGAFTARESYLVVSRLVRYKRIDLAIEACNRLKVNLVIVGCGQDESRLRAIAGSTIRFAGNATDEQLGVHYRRAKALIMPQEEDLGLVALEAQAQGTPVITYRGSGAAELIVEGKTGISFPVQTASSIMEAIRQLTGLEVKSRQCRQHVQQFSSGLFRQNIKRFVEAQWIIHQRN